LDISKPEAFSRLIELEPRRRGWFHATSIAKVIKKPVEAIQPEGLRPTLAKWLRCDGRDAVLLVSKHFVHIELGKIVECNGRVPMRGRVDRVILLHRRHAKPEPTT
jgi:hypothetical protein